MHHNDQQYETKYLLISFTLKIKSPTQKLFPEYDIVFNGHMHGYAKCLPFNEQGRTLLLVYTSSLGRTSSTEVVTTSE